ncbi:WD40-repeat-containing domain protein [Polychytrium aggregatum]|uniref:WD40-repeat-containing domain protein n=1 Tax=Polychytrium aggregatum TaxID=110093 RepID=UPI0022FDC4FA|nr:WD40-repeat-containing domain protein [Polychytrium aggregatum]KAI9203704.1 WD40-repeat-containing domain protein [Polychytrium aggregatum]
MATQDLEVNPPATDGITDLAFSPQIDLLAASSWDNQTRIWEVQPTGVTVAKASIPHEGPALCCAWSKDGTKLVSGGADKAGRMMDITTGQTTQVAAHDAPIKCCKWINTASMNNIIVTGSWDRTIKYWDARQPTPALQVSLPERCFALDVSGELMVVGTAERHILIYSLANPSTPFKQIVSPLKWQTRTIACFPNAAGYAIGSIEGRVGIQYVDERDQAQNFSFKCHRDDKNVYSVNAISFHPQHGTFSTAGSDGTYSMWDKDSKQRLKFIPTINMPISATAFNRTGSIFAYAASYDWSKGHEHYQAGAKNAIMLHATTDEEVKPRPKKR